jgi:hypothetical protein
LPTGNGEEVHDPVVGKDCLVVAAPKTHHNDRGGIFEWAHPEDEDEIEHLPDHELQLNYNIPNASYPYPTCMLVCFRLPLVEQDF